MYLFITNILLLFFGIGTMVTLYLNKSSHPQQALDRWKKLGFYLLILIIIFISIYYKFIFYIALCIGSIGIYELSIAYSKSENKLTFFAISIVIYLLILFGFISFINSKTSIQLCFVYLLVVTFDGFSQLSGQLFGRRKLISKISPNKTLNGSIAGFILGTITSLFIVEYMDISIINGLLSATLICLSAFIGDLLASLYKRKCGIKDYSNLIPGHGGILDRFDSFIFSGSIYWFINP